MTAQLETIGDFIASLPAEVWEGWREGDACKKFGHWWVGDPASCLRCHQDQVAESMLESE
jgi:hypothetical protein